MRFYAAISMAAIVMALVGCSDDKKSDSAEPSQSYSVSKATPPVIGSTKLPADFPKTQVPVIEGVISGATPLTVGWAVTITAGDAFGKADRSLRAAGYTVQSAHGPTTVYIGNAYKVVLVDGSLNPDRRRTVNYTVSPLTTTQGGN